MAGTIITKQQNIISKPNNKQSLETIETTIHCCLWLQQPQVVESTNNNNNKYRPMQQITSYNCHNSKSSITVADNTTPTTYTSNNNNYKQTRPLTLSIAALIMSLSILLIQMPTFAYSKSIYAESPALASLSLDSLESADADSDASVNTQSEIKHDRPSKLILSLFQDIQDQTESASSAERDILTSLDVLRHIERTREYQKERRMRVRKRHTGDLIIKQFLNEHPHNLEWKNPCNVAQVNTNIQAPRVNKQQVYQVS